MAKQKVEMTEEQKRVREMQDNIKNFSDLIEYTQDVCNKKQIDIDMSVKQCKKH